MVELNLANLSAEESAVALDADLAAGQQVGHRRYSFSGVTCARAHRQDKIAQREFRAWLEDLLVRFHNRSLVIRAYIVPFRSNSIYPMEIASVGR